MQPMHQRMFWKYNSLQNTTIYTACALTLVLEIQQSQKYNSLCSLCTNACSLASRLCHSKQNKGGRAVNKVVVYIYNQHWS